MLPMATCIISIASAFDSFALFGVIAATVAAPSLFIWSNSILLVLATILPFPPDVCAIATSAINKAAKRPALKISAFSHPLNFVVRTET